MIHGCGSDNPECAMPVDWPITWGKRALNDITVSEGSQKCIRCEKHEYTNTTTNQWKMSSGDVKCDTDPLSYDGEGQHECTGLCIVSQERFMHNELPYKRSMYRRCDPEGAYTSSTDQRIETETVDVSICKGDLCNGSKVTSTASFSLALISLLLL